MKKTRLISVVLGFCFATNLVSAQQDTQPKPPVAVVSTNLVMLGVINSYEIKKCEIRISNAGESPLNIQDLVPTCNCISGTASQTNLQPKAEGVITLSLNAKLVHDTFKRGVWVVTNDPKNPRILLSVKGEVTPLFEGLPPMPIICRAIDFTVAWTNSFTLTASETNMFLGAPTVRSNNFAQLDVTVKTNTAEKMSYTITTVIKPQDPELHVATVIFPVIGRPGTQPDPVRLQFQTRVGVELHVSPNRILLNPAGTTAPKRLVIHTTERIADSKWLTWSPAIEGVSISVNPPKGLRSNIALTVNVSDEAAQRLLKETGNKTTLTFSYPNHKPVKLSFASTTKAQ